MNLETSVPKNKCSFFNGLQAKLTDSNPVALTNFLNLNSDSKYIDLAKNLQKIALILTLHKILISF